MAGRLVIGKGDMSEVDLKGNYWSEVVLLGALLGCREGLFWRGKCEDWLGLGLGFLILLWS